MVLRHCGRLSKDSVLAILRWVSEKLEKVCTPLRVETHPRLNYWNRRTHTYSGEYIIQFLKEIATVNEQIECVLHLYPALEFTHRSHLDYHHHLITHSNVDLQAHPRHYCIIYTSCTQHKGLNMTLFTLHFNTRSFTDEDNCRLPKCLNCCFSMFWLVFPRIEQDLSGQYHLTPLLPPTSSYFLLTQHTFA